MAKIINIGIIGMSEGNGHPYSWSAIFNGFNREAMKDCPFPGIPEYLEKREFPKDGLQHLGRVTHIWTQDLKISKHIAAASNIETIVEDMEEIIGEVDAILLARDDAENHAKMAKPFLEAGIPIFVDKPLALSLNEAEEILSWSKFESQVFTCSAMRYSDELMLSSEDQEKLGELLYVEAAVMKNWNTYGIHLLEPFVFQLKNRGELLDVNSIKTKEVHQSIVEWENAAAYLKVTGDIVTPYSLKFFGNKGSVTKNFSDSFSCFRKALIVFIEQINTKEVKISRDETKELIKILEWGRI